MNESEAGHHPQKTYILTFDLAQKIKLFRSIGLKTPNPDDTIFTNIKDELIVMVSRAFAGANIRAVSMEDLADEILSRAMDHRKHLSNATVVSTCVEIADLKRGQTIDINRLVGRSGDIIGLGPRPGHPSLEDQIRLIANACDDNPVILMEDGTFTGSTMLQILRMFKQLKVEVAAVVIGFAFENAVKNLKKEFGGELIVVEEMENFIDWMPDHDFFPFVPNCGRVVGVPWNGYNLPLYTHNGASYSIPYVLPFCPMTEWTSIPMDSALEISQYCVKRTKDIFSEMEHLNSKRITMGDLMGVKPRVSIPIAVGQSRLPHMNLFVTDYLSDVCHELA